MIEILLFVVIAIGIGPRILSIIDGLIEVFQHYLGVKMAKFDAQIQKISMENQSELGQVMPQIGFQITPNIEEDDLDD